jgi:hypothetical protein
LMLLSSSTDWNMPPLQAWACELATRRAASGQSDQRRAGTLAQTADLQSSRRPTFPMDGNVEAAHLKNIFASTIRNPGK